jgi:hypothetical protein
MRSKQRQTFAKHKRERAVKEKRALKLEKKAARKQAAADELNGIPAQEAQTDGADSPTVSDDQVSPQSG